jgi:hypothetical protein
VRELEIEELPELVDPHRARNPQPSVRVASRSRALVELADCVCEQLAEIGAGPTCWCGVYPGAEVAWEFCGECSGGLCGMGWVRVRAAFPYDVFPNGLIDFKCNKPLAWHVEAGALRCMPTPPDGQMPSALEMTETALAQAADARALHQAISCCGLDIAIESYVPLGPLGGCVGGVWGAFLDVL